MTEQIVTDHALNGNPYVADSTNIQTMFDNYERRHPPITIPQKRPQDEVIEIGGLLSVPKDVRVFVLYDTLRQDFRGIIHTDNLTLASDEAREAFLKEANEAVGKIDIAFYRQKFSAGLIRLRVESDAMNADGIMPDGMVMVKPQYTIDGNQIAVVYIVDDDEFIIRRVQRIDGGKVKLLASNPEVSESVYPEDAILIVGRVTQVTVDFD